MKNSQDKNQPLCDFMEKGELDGLETDTPYYDSYEKFVKDVNQKAAELVSDGVISPYSSKELAEKLVIKERRKKRRHEQLVGWINVIKSLVR